MGVYENIVMYATKRDLSISQIEKLAGLGNGTIGKWRTFAPNLGNLQKVADVLKVDTKKLIS